MAEALTTLAKLLTVRQIQEDASGAVLYFQEGGHARLAISDVNYAAHLRLARRSQERQHPVGVRFGEGQTVAELLRADNDVPTQFWEEEPDRAQVLFEGHDGIFRLPSDHPEADRIRDVLAEAIRRKARMWFIAQKEDLALLDVMPAGWTAASHTGGSDDKNTAAQGGKRGAPMFKFVGGPYDGRHLDHHFINAVGQVMPVWGSSGVRQFTALPSPEDADAILAGRMEKMGGQGPLRLYERTVVSGGFEYRLAPEGSFDNALAEQHAYQRAPDEETKKRQEDFAKRADELIERVKAIELKSDTEVILLQYAADRQGNRFGPARIELTPTTRVTIPGDKGKAGAWADSLHRDTIIGNINANVRGAATGYFHPHGRPDLEVQLVAFDLEISQPS